MSPILASQEFQNWVLGLRKVLDECQATATLPFLFEGDQFPAFSETDQNVNVLWHDDEAQAESAVLGTQFFEIVNDDPLATILIQQLPASIAGKRDEVRGLRIINGR